MLTLHPRILAAGGAFFLFSAICLLEALRADTQTSDPSSFLPRQPRGPLIPAIRAEQPSNKMEEVRSPSTWAKLRGKSRLQALTTKLRTIEGANLSVQPAKAEASVFVCSDLDESCEHWASKGECEGNPGYMRNKCPKSCNTCDFVEKGNLLCHRTLETKPLLRPGGVNAMFENLVSVLSPTHDVTVHRRPPDGPWVVTIEDFLNTEEVDAVIEKGGHHFERSLAGDGVSSVRTSATSWCNVPFCEADPVIKRVRSRIANVTGVPISHGEHVQVLRYDAGQFYKEHHDQNAHPRSPWGPRLFTFFLYLSNVEEGGGTRFTSLNMTVHPKPGRALVWPSVLDADPSAIHGADMRTMHESVSVVKGEKIAANVWLHQYDFQTALAAGCKNSDYAVCGDCLQDDDDQSRGKSHL